MIRRKQKLCIDGTVLTGIQSGTGLPCLFVGPLSIYLPSFSPDLLEQVSLFGVDHYWTNEADISITEIESLTIDNIVDDLERHRIAFGLDKCLVMGPSALGIVAMAYAAKYPNSTAGVITLSSPLKMENLPARGKSFFDANYNPSMWAGSAKTRPHGRIWRESLARQTLFDREHRSAGASSGEKHRYEAPTFTTPIKSKTRKVVTMISDDPSEDKTTRKYEQREALPLPLLPSMRPDFESSTADMNAYIDELYRDEFKYYRNPEHGKAMYPHWRKFNISMRNQFFKEIFKFKLDFDKVRAPVLSLLGLYDSIVPPYLVPDDMKESAPRDFDYHIFEHSAHWPQIEDSQEVSDKVRLWIENKIDPLSFTKQEIDKKEITVIIRDSSGNADPLSNHQRGAAPT